MMEQFLRVLMANSFGSADVLVEVLARVPLDTYIGDVYQQFVPRRQEGPTCYANAVAAVLHMTMLRIVGYDADGQGMPDFESVRDRILHADNFPSRKQGWSVRDILPHATSWYRLHWKQVSEVEARRAVLARRPVLARFSLSGPGWKRFSDFFSGEKDGILTRDMMKVFRDYDAHDVNQRGGHAVVLTAVSPTGLTFMNSWGKDWGNNGFFKIENASVLGVDNYGKELESVQFFDVFFYESDLTTREREAYRDWAAEQASTASRSFPSLLDLPYKCPVPHCGRISKIGQFEGNVRAAVCPQCGETFKPDAGHLMQALYIRNSP